MCFCLKDSALKVASFNHLLKNEFAFSNYVNPALFRIFFYYLIVCLTCLAKRIHNVFVPHTDPLF